MYRYKLKRFSKTGSDWLLIADSGESTNFGMDVDDYNFFLNIPFDSHSIGIFHCVRAFNFWQSLLKKKVFKWTKN